MARWPIQPFFMRRPSRLVSGKLRRPGKQVRLEEASQTPLLGGVDSSPPERGAVTIVDVARRAQSTPTTVSHAISGARPVSATTRARIAEAIKELGYQPSPAARALATGRSYSIVLDAVTVSDVDNQALWWHIQMAADISHVLEERDYRLIFHASTTLDGERLVQMARTRASDGFILPQIHLADPRPKALRAADVPFVTIGRPYRHREVNWIDADTTGGAAMAVEHLLDLGHRDILYVGWSGVSARYGHTYRVRLGIQDAFRRRDLPWSESLTSYVKQDSSAAGKQAVAEALDLELPFTAVMTGSDALGIGVLFALTERGYQIPDDVSVFSCSDSAAVALAYPPLSTLELPRAQMGKAAVEVLLQQIDGYAPSVAHILLPTSLNIRQSTGPVAPGGRRVRR
jgi:DNA-binding LacI/PurR family transcriptional regulator